MAIALDTLEYARRLRQAGFSEEQAEGQAQALAAAMTDSLATKEDLNALGARLDARFQVVDARFEAVDVRFDALEKQIEIRFAEQEKRLESRLSELNGRFGELDARFGELDARFEGRLADLDRRLTLRLGGITVAGIGAVSALVKLL